jgi:RimJ/RimL family protein N-acetyltransferase
MILQLRKTLAEPPLPAVLAENITIRSYANESDARAWLELRSLAFSKQKRGVQSWDWADFDREFLQKPWWSPGRMWLAELPPLECSTEPTANPLNLLRPLPGQPQLIGTVTLAERVLQEETRYVLHWLLVAPRWRGQGIATALVAKLETAVWELGGRAVYLETHAAWSEAAALYRKLGYEEVR